MASDVGSGAYLAPKKASDDELGLTSKQSQITYWREKLRDARQRAEFYHGAGPEGERARGIEEKLRKLGVKGTIY